MATIAIALPICFGAMLPLCCGLAVVLQMAEVHIVGMESFFAATIGIVHTIALALLGAGAYSVDARRYGRRIVIVPRRHDDG